ncbi:IS66 family transposase [Methylovulum psychrotolerans]|uniref:IS66 family transposase n=1 Tax=Methylovulum psychrotolerans TaxID=1704499 RepID=A0A2S5CKM5_9GAMM|nr:IS66 family transposase [Methylovulum psychrotolerans]
MVDGYAGYKALFTDTGVCTELACFAHARRKFFDLHQANQYPQGHKSPMAWEALQRISVLYAVEAEGKALGIAARQQLRAEKSQPQLRAFHDWLLKTRTVTAPGGASAKALDYTLKRWPALVRYAETGHLPIDNNPVENCIRPIALGKNYAQSVIMHSSPVVNCEAA